MLNIVVKSEIYSELKQALNHKLELFFELLGEPSIERQVWAIVSKLPIS